jgi:hypothetical protein
VAQPDPELVAAIAAYQAQISTLRTNLAAYVQRLWRSLGSWRSGDIARFVDQLVPVIGGAQRQVVAFTAANLARQRQLALGGIFAPVAVDPAKVTGAAARNGVDPALVYERPFHLVWRQLAQLPREPGSVGQAIEAGMNRAVLTAVTDVQLSKVQTAQRITVADRHVTGYRRVLEGTHSCGLCIVASTQRYHKSALMPLHPACDCSISPIYGENDPGQLTDLDTLANVHQAIEDAFGASSSSGRAIPGTPIQYRDVLVSHEHGELGEVLSVKGRPFTGPDDI